MRSPPARFLRWLTTPTAPSAAGASPAGTCPSGTWAYRATTAFTDESPSLEAAEPSLPAASGWFHAPSRRPNRGGWHLARGCVWRLGWSGGTKKANVQASSVRPVVLDEGLDRMAAWAREVGRARGPGIRGNRGNQRAPAQLAGELSRPATRRILFVSVHPPGRVPSQRFRFEQYVDFLREEGFETEFAPVMRQDEYDAIYTEGHHLRKARIAARGLARRILDVARASRYHVVVVQREAVQLGTALFERAFAASRAALVYDF